jgi:integrase
MLRLCKKAGVKHFGFHALRHLGASLINESGQVTMKQIQLLLRHKKQSTTEKYLHILEKGLPEAINLLDAPFSKAARSGTQQKGDNEGDSAY